MNERIHTLAEEAGLYCDGTPDAWDQGAIEKFAQLIVRECAELFVGQKYMVLNPLEPFAYERVRVLKEHDKDTVKKIKQHFGVEE